MRERYQNLIDFLEMRLHSFNTTLNILSTQVEPKFDFRINYNNERSAAAFLTYKVREYFIHTGMLDVHAINEFDIMFDRVLSAEEGQELEDTSSEEISINLSKRKFIPDSFLTFFMPIENTQTRKFLFIEYKTNDKFKYVQLATDFIKFKHYTKGAEVNSVFAYLLLKPKSDMIGLTLLSNGTPTPIFQELSSTISSNQLNTNASVFFYEDQVNGVRNYEEILRHVEHIDDDIKKYRSQLSKVDFDSITNFEENPYYFNAGKFGSRVLVSDRIKRKYASIKNLYNYLSSTDHIIEVPEDAFITSNAFKNSTNLSEDFFVKITQYFNNQIRHQMSEDVQVINGATINYTRKRALWIQMLLQHFAINQGLELEITHFYDEKERSGSSSIYERLMQNYQGDNMKNFNQLAMGLIYYIVKLYDSIFDFEEMKLKHKDEYLAFEIKKTFIYSLKKMNKKLDLRYKNIDWNVDITDEGLKIIVQLLNNESQ